MASPKSISLGVFPAGEIPAAFEHTYKDSNDLAIPLSGFTTSVYISGPDDTAAYATGALAITDAANGVVTYTWSGDEFIDVGKYQMVIWVGNSTNRFGSYLVKWEVYDAPGSLPTV